MDVVMIVAVLEPMQQTWLGIAIWNPGIDGVPIPGFRDCNK